MGFPCEPVRAFQDPQAHLLHCHIGAGFPVRKRSTATVLLLLRSARERRDGVSLAVGRKAPPGQLEKERKKKGGGAHCDSVSPCPRLPIGINTGGGGHAAIACPPFNRKKRGGGALR